MKRTSDVTTEHALARRALRSFGCCPVLPTLVKQMDLPARRPNSSSGSPNGHDKLLTFVRRARKGATKSLLVGTVGENRVVSIPRPGPVSLSRPLKSELSGEAITQVH